MPGIQYQWLTDYGDDPAAAKKRPQSLQGRR
jgi:hypothetical protein